MSKLKILIFLFISAFFTVASAQVKIRLFARQVPESALFSVINGSYEIITYNGENISLNIGEPLIILKDNGRLAIKTRHIKGFVCDSVYIKGVTEDDSFSLRINGKDPVRQNYSGDLVIIPDMETLVMINISDFEKYISGVVRAEGGTGKNIEYFKTQSIIARTYLYQYHDKHIKDGYNVCDNTHCQAFNGLCEDPVIIMAASETRGLVILDQDSTIVISAFHSNCGGETCSSQDVWLTKQPYLKKVIDPYCINSRNARWEKKISMKDWIGIISEAGYSGKTNDPSVFMFSQNSRLTLYKTGTFTMPLKTLRSELNLRSTFFSVIPDGDTIILRGRGYGHGVGLCQEGAMEMAARGFNYHQILDFYYSGAIISDIKNAVLLPETRAAISTNGRF